MCAARGKVILTPAVHTLLHLLLNFHGIIFVIKRITVILAHFLCSPYLPLWA